MTGTPQDDAIPDTPDELAEEAQATREEFGHTLEALADKTDVKARAQERAGDIKTQVEHAAAEAKDRAAQAAHLLHDNTPEPLLEAAGAARRNRTALLAAGAGVLLLVMLVRRATR
ncbi:DUF3618 domain-containing protein [Streptomyces wuyuanensis]|uniref:DUF3618 domain-containing protein n=1 Tax=Streptomyces wuyuanensis TaxID=1196353 RepID=UPI00371270FF